MELEYINGNQEIDIKDNFLKIKEMVQEICFGLIVQIFQVNGKMEFRMVGDE